MDGSKKLWQKGGKVGVLEFLTLRSGVAFFFLFVSLHITMIKDALRIFQNYVYSVFSCLIVVELHGDENGK